MFSVGSAPRLYREDPRPVVFSAVEWSEVKRSSSLVSERVQLSVLSWNSACEEKTVGLVWNGRPPGTQLVEDWQLSGALQGRLISDGAITELTIDKSSVARYSPNNNDMSAGRWRMLTVRIHCCSNGQLYNCERKICIFLKNLVWIAN
jgi:hypothetical protein